MAKQKPSRAFLEALQQEKRRRGDDKPGGGFQTPEWFFKQKAEPSAPPTKPLNMPAGAEKMAFGPMVQRKQKFRLTWMHGVLAAILIGAVVTAALIFGRAKPNDPQLSKSDDQIKKAPAQTGVLDLTSDRATTPKLPPPPMIPVANPPAAPAGANPSTPAQPEVTQSGRIVGMNYVVIQSYAPTEEKLANDAVAALKAGGIDAKIEHGLRGYKAGWHIVVGTTPFARISTPEFQDYVKKVRTIGEKFAGSVKWKQFQPTGYRWD